MRISGTFALIIRSTPCLSVKAAIGQPAQAPCKRTFTVSFSMATSSMSPPSAWILGFISARAASTLFWMVSLILVFTTFYNQQ